MRRLPLALLVGLAGVSACITPQGEDAGIVDPTSLPQPTITTVDLSCDREAGRWSVDVRTSAWTGGGGLVWTTDGTYVERHDGLRSVRAGADGLSDRLALDVTIVDDVRGAASGRTVLRCASNPVVAVFVESLDGQVVDCVRLSDDGRLDGAEELPADCARVLPGDSDDG